MPKYTDPFAAIVPSAVVDNLVGSAVLLFWNAADANNSRKPSEIPVNLPPMLASVLPKEKNPAQSQKDANVRVRAAGFRRDRATNIPDAAISNSNAKNGPAVSAQIKRNSTAPTMLLRAAT